ncbi:MAG: hypothetical protein P8X69_02615, partial [Maritimibacter sp.]
MTRLRTSRNALHPTALRIEPAGDLLADPVKLAQQVAALTIPVGVTRLRAVMAAGIGDETFRECGWRKVRHTVIRAVPVHETLGPAPDPRLHILPDDQSTAIWSDWVEAHWRHYQATHTDNPPVLPSGGPRALFLGDDLEAGNAVALIEAGRVVGFASLRAVAGECAESGWIAAPGIRE